MNTIFGPVQHNEEAMLRQGVMVKDHNNDGVLMCLKFVILLVVLLYNIVNKEFLFVSRKMTIVQHASK